jgi:RNA polymerase sigma-70 factor (ECF subfamily)
VPPALEGGAAIAVYEPSREREVTDLQDRRDREILDRVAGGGEEAFAELYRRYAPASSGLAHRVLRDPSLAEEVVQEVFLAVWKSASSFDSARGSVRSWLLSQVHHRAVDAVRREDAQRRRTARQAVAGAEDHLENVVEEEWMASRRREVRATLESLSSEQRQVLELAYFGGLTQTQIASRIGVPLGTVKSRTLAGMNALRRALARSEER